MVFGDTLTVLLNKGKQAGFFPLKYESLIKYMCEGFFPHYTRG